MAYIVHLNPAIGSENLGDFIIGDSVRKVLQAVFKSKQIIELPTQLQLCKKSRKLIQQADMTIIGGTNLLRGDMSKKARQWKINPIDMFSLENNVVLLGVGWWQYQNSISPYSRYLYSRVFSKDFIHSVRDNYTESKLRQAGFDNVVNTGCPTMWELSGIDSKITKPASSVVVTLTNYNKNAEKDSFVLNMVSDIYDDCWFWPQNYDDLRYAIELGCNKKFKILSPNVASFDELVVQGQVDYIGTRLHAGIRALQKGCRALIISVDNRATEISKDTNLCVVERSTIDGDLGSVLARSCDAPISISSAAIEKWTEQFANAIS